MPASSANPDTATQRDLAMMRRALALAERAAELGEVPVAAIVYPTPTTEDNGDTPVELLAEAHNRRELDQDPTAHAEIIALRDAARRLGTWRLTGYTLAVTLEPCPMCAGALVNARIDRLVYGADDPKMGCARTLHALCDEPRFNHRMAVVPGVLADESAELLRNFFRARRGR
ncbi:MAG: nucleoside deaminase [Planctomycetota bacterium]